MKKIPRNPLRLHRETLGQLENELLLRAEGGSLISRSDLVVCHTNPPSGQGGC